MREKRDEVKLKLYTNTLTNSWLIDRLYEIEIYTDKTELSSVLKGVRTGNKADIIIDKSLEILNTYEERMNCKRNS